jgi:branched-chain amino acid transport system permease protein
MKRATALLGRLPLAFSAVACLAVIAASLTLDVFVLLQATVYAAMAILALSLAFVWGYGGIMSFGQAAFFGLGGYTYAVAASNFGDSTFAILLSVLVPSLFAAALGYFMFFGRLGNLYVGIVTLCVGLVLFNFMNSTSDAFYRIGNASLNGFNGMAGIPPINMPFSPGDYLDPQATFLLSALSLVAAYIGLRALLLSPFGRVLVGVRENEERASLLGYNVPLVKLAAFTIAAGLAGYAGCLYANWNGFIGPTVFGLGSMAQVIIWTVAGGLGTLIGPVVGAIGLQVLVTWLGTAGLLDANIVLGAVLMAVVVFLPNGLVPGLASLAVALRHVGRRITVPASAAPKARG